jgi:hypothetical protein
MKLALSIGWILVAATLLVVGGIYTAIGGAMLIGFIWIS